MDFPQQVEETLVEKPAIFDITMEPLLEEKHRYENNSSSILNVIQQLNSQPPCDFGGKGGISNAMISSITSTLDDNTPSDSGVQLLDSESSELMIESITSATGFDFDEKCTIVSSQQPSAIASGSSAGGQISGPNCTNGNQQPQNQQQQQLPDLLLPTREQQKIQQYHQLVPQQVTQMTKSDFENSNVVVEQTPPDLTTHNNVNNEDVMTTSNCSTFDTENIVYRRKVKKIHGAGKTNPPKKRVSFHEDILKNTKTDNIHIEHGFITYKNGRKSGVVAGRYSWCSEGDGEEFSNQKENNERQVVYRNACSDVLDYGNAEIFECSEGNYLKQDNSGIFEYYPHLGDNGKAEEIRGGNQRRRQMNDPGKTKHQMLYKCSCSSSNSSLDSGDDSSGSGGVGDKNSNRRYEQAKSNSCDCIGANNNNNINNNINNNNNNHNGNSNNNFIGDNCYFSEPSIGNLNETIPVKKSVWNKEKKPKSSCLKKSRRHTDIVQEHDLSTKVKKFNVHDMNSTILDNSKMIFGSLKSIFTIPLPERGVPEGSEDVQSVYECIPDGENDDETSSKIRTSSSPVKPRNFLSKSLDGGLRPGDQNAKKKFIHNVDEQLRRKNEEDLYAPTRQNSDDDESKQQSNEQQDSPTETTTSINTMKEMSGIVSDMSHFRNKFIINCESTVFEHTGVSYSYENDINSQKVDGESVNVGEKATPVAASQKNIFISAAPIKQTLSNIFKTLKETATSPTSKKEDGTSFFDSNEICKKNAQDRKSSIDNNTMNKKQLEDRNKNKNKISSNAQNSNSNKNNVVTINASMNGNFYSDKQSICSDVTSSITTTASTTNDISDASWQKICPNLNVNQVSPTGIFRNAAQQSQNRHLSSPMRRRGFYGNIITTTARYERNRMSPDLFNLYGPGGNGRDSKNTILTEEFDDILTITTTTTDTDKNESDIVILDYPESNNNNNNGNSEKVDSYGNNNLKPPSTKSSLINRFLRNVTQKKILESSIRRNNFFVEKIKNERKLFSGNLYVKGIKPKNPELIEDLNAEIAMEIEMSGMNSPKRDFVGVETNITGDISRFELGIGEISVEIFNGNCLHILRDATETLMKVFKLYTGYSREGYMTPVLVFLTDRTLYVTDLVRNRLCNKFVLPYSELDVILMGPYGNTVLLSNSARNMQQVLLAGGPYPADGLVANLELCARRSGSVLPAVGQLTLDHLAPLQTFVRENSSIPKKDAWVYYAVVSTPAGSLGSEQEPLGPHIKGFLMHRRIQENNSVKRENWHAGYFLLKAGVLYMFNDSTQKLPTWAMALAECQGARRAMKTGRPHCFEILLKHEVLQLAAPDEYVASEWLQALVQSASGLFEMQEKHKTLGCTLVMTENHLITLREDFRAPLRKINKTGGDTAHYAKLSPLKENIDPNNLMESSSNLSSAVSTPTRNTYRSNSSINSTPTKISQLSKSTIVTNFEGDQEKSSTSMSSFYGKNSGVEVLTCAAIKEMVAIRIPSHNESWWCIMEFSCQEVRENSDDLVVFFASSSEMQRFLRMLEALWQSKNNDLFPVTILDEDDVVSEQCTKLYMDINKSWEPLLSAALGYPQ